MLYLRNIFLFLILAAMIGCGEGTRHVEMVRMLEQAEGMNRDYVPMDTLQGIEELTDYFMAHGSAEERIRANYMMGSVFRDRGDSPMALEYYLKAVSLADTTKADCNFDLLGRVWGQIAGIFHQQNLPQDEIWAWKRHIDCARRGASEEDYVIAKLQLLRPYVILEEKDSVLNIINECYEAFMRLGNKELAASSLPTAIYIYMERGQMAESRKAMKTFEDESGLFDADGNIAAGREGYYYIKGFVELASHNLDLAEKNFRKAIQHGYLSDGYKGLLRVYREKHNPDSVFRFSELYEAAQDTLHNQMQTSAIHQMAALYDYTRSQKEAEQERANSMKARFWALLIAVAALLVIGALIFYHRQNERKRKRKIQELEQDLNNAKVARAEISEELRQLKDKDYESVIAAKEERLAELTEKIEQLSQDGVAREKDNLEQFQNSEIAALFVKKATEKTEKVQPTEAEWKLLLSQFSQDNPATFKSFGTGKALSKLEQRICILLVLDIPEYVIAIMTNSSASTVSNSKARANEKLFGKKDARTLKINLIHAMKA